MTFWIIFGLYVLPIIVHLIRAIFTDDQCYNFDNPHSHYMWISIFIPGFNIIVHFKGDWTYQAREKEYAIEVGSSFNNDNNNVIHVYCHMSKRFESISPLNVSKGDIIVLHPETNSIYRYAKIVGVLDTNFGFSADKKYELLQRRFLIRHLVDSGENMTAFTVDFKRNRHYEERKMINENISCIVRKKVKVHMVEGVPFYIQDGKVYNLPKYQEGYTLYYVVRDGHATLELVKEEA